MAMIKASVAPLQHTHPVLIQQAAPPDQFNELFYAYKMSLQTFEP